MIIKGIGGKIGRFILGRFRAVFEKTHVTGIPETCLAIYPPPPGHDGRKSLPLVVFFSGDGGWANLTTSVSEHLQKFGYPVLGIDSMQYFWNEKQPDEAARDLEKTIMGFQDKWNANQLILLGYSMGADVLPVIARNLKKEVCESVEKMILLSPSKRVELKFRFIGWLGYHSPEDRGLPILPDVETVSRDFPVVCFSGDKEQNSLTSIIPKSTAISHTLPGGHHYSGDYVKLSKAIEKEICRIPSVCVIEAP